MAATTTNRARKFALPDLADDRGGEMIEAFLQGPEVRTGRARSVAAPQVGDAVALRSMPGRLDWNAALDRESTRASRYGRPAAVAIFEIRPLRPSATIDSWLRLHAAPIGQVLLRMSRATDVVARVTASRFQVLLPETAEPAAGEFVERVVGECQEHLRAAGAPLRLQASIAAASHEVPLQDALAKAVRSIEAA
jgi:GGDEF domain-containing protein